MTNPISKFTVPVKYHNTLYDVEITPTLNGKVLPLMPSRVNQWIKAEEINHLFSIKIVEMLNAAAVPADALIQSGSAEGFTLADSMAKHKTVDIWEEFIECLQDPASYTAGVPELDNDELSNQEELSGASLDSEDEISQVGPGARVQFTPNASNSYKNLSPVERRTVRFSTFEKKVKERFKLPFNPYTPEEIGCLSHFVTRSPDQPLSLHDEEMAFWRSVKIPEDERDKFSLLWSKIRTEHDSLPPVHLIEEDSI